MAEILENKLLYSELLQSDGFVIDYAVCTTYSLDMLTLLSIPFLMGTTSELTEKTINSPHLLLDAISKASKKFCVFCNAGCISVPTQESNVFSLLEKSVVQVTLNVHGKGFVNFHPKVWIIKETNSDNRMSRIKVIVMSRNLSKSNDLDIACEMTADIGKKKADTHLLEKHKPLKDFLSWLLNHAKESHIKKSITGICEDIDKLSDFNLNDSTFNDYAFFPMGIKEGDGISCMNEMLEYSSDMLIVSPFIDYKTLYEFKNHSSKSQKTLVTKHSSIKKEIMNLFDNGNGNSNVYVVKEGLTDKSGRERAVDLHEKMYFIHNYNSSRNHLYLGSTNATQNGFKRNVEFLLRLTFAPNKMSYNKFRNELINNNDDCLFERAISIVDEQEIKEDANKELALRKAIASIKKAVISSDEGCTYQVCVHCSSKMPTEQIFIHPLYNGNMQQPLADKVTFRGIELKLLTEFFVITVGDPNEDGIKKIVKIETFGMPDEEREKAIINSIIDTPNKFINYLSFMLTENHALFLAEYKDAVNNGSAGNNQGEITPSLYEDMVRTAYKSPEKIESIRKTISKLNESVMPKNFKSMYEQFEKAVKDIKKIKCL